MRRLRFLAILSVTMVAISILRSAALAESAPEAPAIIRELNIVHFSHTDVGFTDHPDVCRDFYRRYLDIALDTALDTMKTPEEERFRWTAEATLPVYDWWQAADAHRRKQFLKAVRAGQIEITALPFNNTPFLDAQQWHTMLHWLPDPVWDDVRPRVAVQDDVNGFPRAGATGLLDRGVRYLFTGINEDSGGVPFPRPSAFWWKMPDGRRLFVWLNIGYGSGFDFFEPAEWRRGPVPRAADTTYRPPRDGDILKTDRASLQDAHRLCLQRLLTIEKQGYKFPVLTISITSQWRFDNDPPFPPLAKFIAAWNRMGLQPRLRLSTVGEAMEKMEKLMGPTAPEHSGEWTDWWANGTASGPREVAASRFAKRYLKAASSSVWGPSSAAAEKTADELYRDLCLFDEHTWGSSLSVAKPYSLDTLGQFNEKSRLAWRPMARAEWLLSQRARASVADAGEGLFVVNPTKSSMSGWVNLIATCLRDDYKSLEDPDTGKRTKLYFEPGIQPWGRPASPRDLSREDISATFPDQAPNRVAKFWLENIGALTKKRLRLSKAEVADHAAAASGPAIDADLQGWPRSVKWDGMSKPLFIEGFGQFTAIQVEGFAPRWVLADIRGLHGAERDRVRGEKLKEIVATAEGLVTRQENPHTILISQWLKHQRLVWALRQMEVWKREPRVRLTFRLNRITSSAPEIFYLDFPLPTGESLPRLSCGGMPFTPFNDQLPGTCRDYFAFDSWAQYTTSEGQWIWVSRDAPLLTFGASPSLAASEKPPADVHRLRAMLLNNFWYTNFLADEPGIMEFQFDLLWHENRNRSPQDLADALLAEPVVVINPGLKEDPRVLRHLF